LLKGARVTGEIRFNGIDLLHADEALLVSIRGAQIGFVFQDPLSALNPLHTIGHQVAEPLVIRGVPWREARRRAIDVLSRVGIQRAAERFDDYPHQFSGGMRQRVVIASAVIAEPTFLIADEPTTALDVRVQAQVLDLIHGLAVERKMAVILISHDLGVLAGHTDRVAIMYAGRMAEVGSTEAIYYRGAHPYTWGLIGSVPRIDSPLEDWLQAIPGQPPSLASLPAGCRFNPRCVYAQDVCRQDPPPELRETDSPDHRAACHFAGQLPVPDFLRAQVKK
jgi:oligopeptide/dipeptide ABC transporter ATP-binding protein